MTCPNCGLSNPDTAKFCANCGTTLAGSSNPQPGYQQQSYQQQPYQQPYQPAAATTGSTANPLLKNIAIGCLIVFAIFVFMGLSCTRACLSLGHRRSYIQRRY